MEIMELYHSLESNEPHVAEQVKKRFHESFNASKESWILYGLFDYFVQTNSIRSVEIIVSAREPHDKHLYDRIDDAIKQNSTKLQALTLLGHVVRRQPPWIYKITQHPLLKNILKLLKTETEILPLMSALLIMIILLPMIPANIGVYLNDLFEIFSRLAAWNRNNPGKLADEHLMHLQVGMYALFLRLYGMYPCNFLSYLRQTYGTRDHLAVFSHTIKPMLDTVKMHPLLVTASKDNEISTSRWKKMGHHDVIVECAKLTLDPIERLREEPIISSSNSGSINQTSTSFRSQSVVSASNEHSSTNVLDRALPSPICYAMQLTGVTSTSLCYGSSTATEVTTSELFSPTLFFQQHSTSPPVSEINMTSTSIPQTPIAPNSSSTTPQTIVASINYPNQEGTSPPEAAVEATPETTPVKDLRLPPSKSVPPNSSVVRALSNFNATKWPDIGGSSQSQPSSPMKKDTHSSLSGGGAFKFPTMDLTATTSAFEQPSPRKDLHHHVSSQQYHPQQIHHHYHHHQHHHHVDSFTTSTYHNKFDSCLTQRVSRLVDERNLVNETGGLRELRAKTLLNQQQQQPPTSPLRIIGASNVNNASIESCTSPIPNSPIPIETTAPTPGARADWHVTKPKAEKNGFRFESSTVYQQQQSQQQTDISQEDQEVVEIVRRGEQYRTVANTDSSTIIQQQPLSVANRNCDSVIQDFPTPHNEDFEECEQKLLESPCTLGGLHMPNSHSMRHLAKRLTFYNQCVNDTSSADHEFSTGSSPNDRLSSSLETNKVRRANSCPEMKKSYSKLSLDSSSKIKIVTESDEEVKDDQLKQEMNGNIVNAPEIQCSTIGVQTVEIWPQPYEHLFLELLPNVVSTMPTTSSTSDIGSEQQNVSSFSNQMAAPIRFSPYEMLDRCIEIAKQHHTDKEIKRNRNYEIEIKSLREQLELVHLQVQFERHRRDVHSERNRRLMGKAKSNRTLEECNNALRDQIVLSQKEIDSLRIEIQNKSKKLTTIERKCQDNIDFWQKQCTALQEENRILKQQKETLEEELKAQNTKVIAVNTECQQTEAALLEKENELHFATQQAMAGEQTRAELDHLQKEHVMLGELHLKCLEHVASLPNIRARDEEVQLMSETYIQEIENLNQQLLKNNALIESLKIRNNELENTVTKHDEMCGEQKRMLKIVKDEYQEELNAVETKYSTQRAIIKRMEENILELHTRLDRFESSRRAMQSPIGGSSSGGNSTAGGRDIGGSGDKVAASFSSPHSSPPLSVSLTSSEGGTSMAFLQITNSGGNGSVNGANTSTSVIPSDVEIKNLQVIVDQSEQERSQTTSFSQSGSGDNNEEKILAE